MSAIAADIPSPELIKAQADIRALRADLVALQGQIRPLRNMRVVPQGSLRIGTEDCTLEVVPQTPYLPANQGGTATVPFFRLIPYLTSNSTWGITPDAIPFGGGSVMPTMLIGGNNVPLNASPHPTVDVPTGPSGYDPSQPLTYDVYLVVNYVFDPTDTFPIGVANAYILWGDRADPTFPSYAILGTQGGDFGAIYLGSVFHNGSPYATYQGVIAALDLWW